MKKIKAIRGVDTNNLNGYYQPLEATGVPYLEFCICGCGHCKMLVTEGYNVKNMSGEESVETRTVEVVYAYWAGTNTRLTKEELAVLYAELRRIHTERNV